MATRQNRGGEGDGSGGGDGPLHHFPGTDSERASRQLKVAYPFHKGVLVYKLRRKRLGLEGVDVPKESDLSLYYWSKALKQSYRAITNGRVRAEPMSPDDVELLSRIGFPLSSRHCKWEKHFEFYKGFVKSPEREDDQDDHEYQVAKQRYKNFEYNTRENHINGLLSDIRVERLNGIGFVWSGTPRFDRLLDYFNRLGHYRLYHLKKLSPMEHSAYQLAHVIRSKYFDNTLDEAQIEKFNAIHFDWDGGTRAALLANMQDYFDSALVKLNWNLEENPIDIRENDNSQKPLHVVHFFHSVNYPFGHFGNPLVPIALAINEIWYKKQQEHVLEICRTRVELDLGVPDGSVIQEIVDDTVESVKFQEVIEIAGDVHFGVILAWLHRKYDLDAPPNCDNEDSPESKAWAAMLRKLRREFRLKKDPIYALVTKYRKLWGNRIKYYMKKDLRKGKDFRTLSFIGMTNVTDELMEAFAELLFCDIDSDRAYEKDHMFPVSLWKVLFEMGLGSEIECLEAVFSIWNVVPKFWGKNALKLIRCIYHGWYDKVEKKWYWYVPGEDEFLDILAIHKLFGNDLFLNEREAFLLEDWNSGWDPKRSIAFSEEGARALLEERRAWIANMEPGTHASSFPLFLQIREEGNTQHYMTDARTPAPDDIDDRDLSYKEEDDDDWLQLNE